MPSTAQGVSAPFPRQPRLPALPSVPPHGARTPHGVFFFFQTPAHKAPGQAGSHHPAPSQAQTPQGAFWLSLFPSGGPHAAPTGGTFEQHPPNQGHPSLPSLHAMRKRAQRELLSSGLGALEPRLLCLERGRALGAPGGGSPGGR